MTSATRRAAIVACALSVTGVLSAQPPQARVDEYTRYELLPPETSSVKVTYELGATTEGALTYTDRLPTGTVVTNVAVTDMMTGAPLRFAVTPGAITVTLARAVPPKGQGRIRIEKTVKSPLAYKQAAGAATFTALATLVLAAEHRDLHPATERADVAHDGPHNDEGPERSIQPNQRRKVESAWQPDSGEITGPD